MSKATWGWVVIVILVIAVIFVWMSRASAPATTPDMQNTQASSTLPAPAGSSAAPMTATVSYDGSSFSPASVTIAQGGTVQFVDTAAQPFWVASDPHPVHTGYDGTTMQQHCAQGYAGAAPFDECAPGTSFSFTFDKAGSWGYHDHLDARNGGTIVVVAQ